MSRKHDKKMAEIVQAKADFLITCQAESVNFAVVTAFDVRESLLIAGMPTRGFRQRELQVKAYHVLDEAMARVHQRIGASVMRTYAFVTEHRRYLSPGARKMLFGSEK